MNEAQKNAMEAHEEELCNAIEPNLFLPFSRTEGILNEFECELITNMTTSRGQVSKTFSLLMPKEGSWEVVVSYLQEHRCLNMVEILKRSEEDHTPLQPDQDSVSISWQEFICDVADFYLRSYRVVEGFDVDGDSDLIESVWVDLQLEGCKEPIDDYNQIFARMRKKNCRWAIVSGQPGSGKTTLVKKIAYDWARKQSRTTMRKCFTFLSNINRFDLVLVVPLRKVPTKADLMQLAVGMFVGHNNAKMVKQICEDIRRRRLRILLILDGLDEYQIPSDSPLHSLFGYARNTISTNSPVKFDFDLLITSRPFACQLTHASIATVKYEIVGLAEGKLVEFVRKRCKRPGGIAKAIECFSTSNCLKDVSQNPFLLSLICFLCDLHESIPLTLTKLYCTFVHRMLLRAEQKCSMGKNVDPSNWQQSKLLRNLGSLALFGVVSNLLQFTENDMLMCNVNREDFHSGLLHYYLDPGGLALKCDFAHRSIQDFLAAFYAVKYWGDKTLMDATGWPVYIWRLEFVDFLPEMKVEYQLSLMVDSHSQFCRFFCGLISGKPDFSDRYRQLFTAMISRFTADECDLIWILLAGCDVADCSNEEQLVAGQIANELVDRCALRHDRQPTELDEKIFKFLEGASDCNYFSVSSVFDLVPYNFCKGLKLFQINDEPESFFIEAHTDQHLKVLHFSVDDKDILDYMDVVLPFNHVRHLHICMENHLHENIAEVRKILSHISSVESLLIDPLNTSPYICFVISVEAQLKDSPKAFSLNYLRIDVSSDIGHNMLEKFQSATHFQQGQTKVAALERWKIFSDNFSVTILFDNDMSNVDIWDAVCASMCDKLVL